VERNSSTEIGERRKEAVEAGKEGKEREERKEEIFEGETVGGAKTDEKYERIYA